VFFLGGRGKWGGLPIRVFLLGGILPNFDLKNMILTCTYKEFFIEKNWPKFARFRTKKKVPNQQIFFLDNFCKLPKIWKIST
jgi:hypothetical protein